MKKLNTPHFSLRSTNLPQPLPSQKHCTNVVIFTLILLFLTLPTLCFGQTQKKILHIDSYHSDFDWSHDISAGIRTILESRDDIEFRTFYMDTKRHQSIDFKQQAALKAKHLIESWRPDVVIASDDNAAKYLIAPYYRNSNLPVVFCGLNWDASVYGFPADNITGIIEVAMVETTIEMLQQYTSGEKIGYLASDTVSERKEYQNIVARFGDIFEVHFVQTFDELVQAYRQLQQTTSMTIIQECRSVKNFNHLKMVNLVNEETWIPTGAMQKYLNEYALLTVSKSGQEQGEYAARTALKLLAGTPADTIPVVANKKAQVYLNMSLANKMGIKFPIELINRSHLINTKQKKLLYVNSYHEGYKWSDDIEKGLLKALKIQKDEDGNYDESNSSVTLKVFRMDSKRKTSEAFKKEAALRAKEIIDVWQPDIIVASDDNAAKYFLAPYVVKTQIPAIFCGINWSADSYAFPADQITGMIEINPIMDTLSLLRNYAQGERLGYLGANVYSEEKEVEHLQKAMQRQFSDGALVSDYQQWKEAYLQLQKTVDMILILDPAAVKNWNEHDAKQFILKNTTIPSGSLADNDSIHYALLGKVKVAEEQGWWSGNTALRILSGTPAKEIAVTTNKHNKLFLNMNLAKKLNITFPLELLDQATLIQ